MKLCQAMHIIYDDRLSPTSSNPQAAIITHVQADGEGNTDTRNGPVSCDVRTFPRLDGPQIKNSVPVFDTQKLAYKATNGIVGYLRDCDQQ